MLKKRKTPSSDGRCSAFWHPKNPPIEKDFYDQENPEESQIIARQTNNQQNFQLARRFGNSNVILVTATPGTEIVHAAICTTRDYESKGFGIIPSKRPEIVERCLIT